MTATNTTSRLRRGTVTAAAVTEPCALIVIEGVLAVAVGERDGLRSVAASDELNVDTLVVVGERDGLRSVAASDVDTLVGTAEQRQHSCEVLIFLTLYVGNCTAHIIFTTRAFYRFCMMSDLELR